ncbi:MAG: hypothetical protein QXY39_02760 [Thermofilaceae archaeon]
MTEPLRFKIRRPVCIGNKILHSGVVSLSMVINNLPELLSLGCLEELPPRTPFSGYALVLRASRFGEFGEVVAVDDIKDFRLWVTKGFLLPLYDNELNDVSTCEVCHKHYINKDLLAQHKQQTGHRRKYTRRTGNT